MPKDTLTPTRDPRVWGRAGLLAAAVLTSAATHGAPSRPALGETSADARRYCQVLPRLVPMLLVEVASLRLGTARGMRLGMSLGTGLGTDLDLG